MLFGADPTGYRARSSAGEHYLDMVGVTGSIPVAPTISFNGLAGISDFLIGSSARKKHAKSGIISPAMAASAAARSAKSPSSAARVALMWSGATWA
jgi:hypothetical protein